MTEEFIYEPELVQQIDPDEVIVPERQRLTYDNKFIEELAASIAEVGQLQPAILYQAEDGLTLIAGENRRRACKKLGQQLKYILKEDLTDPYSLEAAELYENLCRNNLSWQEEDRAMAKLHKLREEQHGVAQKGRYTGQTLEKTATELKSSRRKLSRAIEIEPFLELPEIANAKSRQEGHNKLKAMLESMQREAFISEALKTPSAAPSAEAVSRATEAASSMGDIGGKGEEPPKIEEGNLLLLAQYAERVKLATFEDLIPTLPNEHFDIVIFDPPWGVDYDKVMHDTGSVQKYEDSEEAFRENFPKYISSLFNVMSQDSHLYLFFGITWHQFVYDSLEAAGFNTNRMPLFWHKRGAGRTRNPDIWPGRSYEAIAYARKGSKSLVLKGKADVIITAPPTRNMKLSHPSAKHPDIMLDLLKRSAQLGDKVLDPMCGSGMTAVACEHPDLKPLKLNWTLADMEEEFVNLALWNLGKGYYGILDMAPPADPATKLSAEEKALISAEQYERDHPIQEEPLPADFRMIEPGSAVWKKYWKAHPEQQDAMIKFRASCDRGAKVMAEKEVG